MSVLKKGQTWSTDATVAVVLFVLVAIILFYLTGPASSNKSSEGLQSDADKLPSVLSSPRNFTVGFIKNSRVDDVKLFEAMNQSYETLKQAFGITSDFCIYFEDDKGNIVPINGRIGIGSPLVNFTERVGSQLVGRSCNDSISG